MTSFASTYLGVSSVNGDVAQKTVTGAGSVFGLGSIANYPFYNFSDLISPDVTAESAFSGDKGNAAIDKNGGIYAQPILASVGSHRYLGESPASSGCIPKLASLFSWGLPAAGDALRG